MKLQLQSIVKAKTDNDNLKKEMEKLNRELKQSQIELKEAREGEIKLVLINSKTALEAFKRSNELQQYLFFYGVGSYDMACEDLSKYLTTVQPFWNLEFINIIKQAFHKGKDLDNIIAARGKVNKFLLKILFHYLMMLLLLLSKPRK